MNIVLLCGRLTKDADVRVAGQTNVARFTLAVDRDFKKDGEPTADFINCIAFGKTAEVIEKYVSKGTKLIIRGRWQSGSYDNKDGQKVYTNDCVIDKMEFAESKNGNGNPKPMPASAIPGDGFMDLPLGVEDAGLPFN